MRTRMRTSTVRVMKTELNPQNNKIVHT